MRRAGGPSPIVGDFHYDHYLDVSGAAEDFDGHVVFVPDDQQVGTRGADLQVRGFRPAQKGQQSTKPVLAFVPREPAERLGRSTRRHRTGP